MTFKDQRISDEFKQLSVMNPRLYNLLNILTVFTQLEFNKSILITSIFRTAEEHKDLYKNTPNPPVSSVHCQWEGADLRSRDFTDSEKKRLTIFANQFTFRNGKPVMMIHTVPNSVEHCHIQLSKCQS